jgi:hypothetical protein
MTSVIFRAAGALVLAAAGFALLTTADAVERVGAFVRRYERYELDEILVLATVLVILGLGVLAFRNNRAAPDRSDLYAPDQPTLLCVSCKRVGDAEGRWRELEDFASARPASRLTHAVCPNCLTALGATSTGTPESLRA